MAKYTFTEQCEEVAGLHLEDGTSKIFLNMRSKNGRPELVSLLQYMKQTSMDNPGIIVRNRELIRLDEIVTEVKQSEEWENVKMNLLEYGIERGMECGMKRGIERGLKEGIVRGRIELVCRKFAPDYDCEKVFQEYCEGHYDSN